MQLTSKQIKRLRGLAHHLNPVVMVGKSQITEAVAKELSLCLKAHELIKVKILCDEREDFLGLLDEITELTKAVLVQTIGRMIVLYAPNPEKPKIAV